MRYVCLVNAMVLVVPAIRMILGASRTGARFRAFLCICFVFICCSTALADDPPAASSSSASPEETIITQQHVIELKAGEKKRVRAEANVLEVAVTRPEIVEGFLSGTQHLVLVANSPGIGKIILRLDNEKTVAYTVQVYVSDPEKFAAELREQLKDVQNLNIEVVKEKILVEGRVLYLKDMDAIERAVGNNPSIINLTSLSSRNARILAREIERELRESGIYGVEVEVRKNKVTLVGTLASEVLIKKARQIASSYTPNYDSLLTTGKPKEKEKLQAAPPG